MLLIAGAGSGKTEVMARRVAWWLAVDGVPKDAVVAFTFTERAAEEMKFRIRKYVQLITPEGEDATLGGMYVGTIHSYCLKLLREAAPTQYHNYDVVDDIARVSFVQRQFHGLLGLPALQSALSAGLTYKMSQSGTVEKFLDTYDLINEYDALDVTLPPGPIPTTLGATASDWCKEAVMNADVGCSDGARAFAMAAARYYAALRSRRFLDFSTSQTEIVRLLRKDPEVLNSVREQVTHVVVDEVQDINPVQDSLIRLLVGETGHVTAVGDHRQAIFGWRGGRVEIMANLAAELVADEEGQVLELTHNFRSTPRIIELSNAWNRTIGFPSSLSSPDMLHGRLTRVDYDPSHTATVRFPTRTDEAAWIAATIKRLVNRETTMGARHDSSDGDRGIALSDVAVLLRSSKDARTYMTALRQAGIPAVVRAGPDLFSQPEVLLVVGILGLSAGMAKFLGGKQSSSLPNRIKDVLGCDPTPDEVIQAASAVLRAEGLTLEKDVEDRLLLGGALLRERMSNDKRIDPARLEGLKSPELREFLARGPVPLRRVFPQALFHAILGEIGVHAWDATVGRAAMAMFHLGQFSSLVTGIETPGWTSAREYPYQISALLLWGTKNGRVEEAPLLVAPDAVQISTIHTAKGLEYAAVFVADVCSARFPSNQARRAPQLPLDGPFTAQVDPASLADNANRDGERRLMYVAITRAERYLFVTSSKPSDYFAKKGKASTGISELVTHVGGVGRGTPGANPINVDYLPSRANRESRLVTSFSDLRYYLECPHDFYLRKVLGFAPTIDQAFGYGRGVHNLLREVHSNAKEWAELASEPTRLRDRLRDLVRRGLFYLRHTVGEPADRMQKRAVEVVADYVRTYQTELTTLVFEPEREFETLIEEEQVLVSGAIDVIRLDDPPRITIVDFKSGEPESNDRMSLDSDEMKLQVAMYGLAARHELEYEPDRGLVRYLGAADPTERELPVGLDEDALSAARKVVVDTSRDIRQRRFSSGPTRGPRKAGSKTRCEECDFVNICGMPAASSARRR